MRLTGKLFKLRRDVVLGRNVLDVPGIFWEEASLHALYEAGRAYFEIGERVQGLNERISGARDLVRCRLNTGRKVDSLTLGSFSFSLASPAALAIARRDTRAPE